MDIEELINKVNELLPYGISISNNSVNEEDLHNEVDIIDVRNKKSQEWMVTANINKKVGDINHVTHNKNLAVALKEMYDFLLKNKMNIISDTLSLKNGENNAIKLDKNDESDKEWFKED